MTQQLIIAQYQPGDSPPGHKLGSESNSEEVTTWCQTFKTYIQAGKVKPSLNIPYNMIVGHVAKLCETEFFDNTLRLFINNNRPEEEIVEARMSEDIIVDLIYHYYSSTSLVYSQITPIRLYNHQ